VKRLPVEDMSRDEGSTYFIGNPSLGIAGDFPKATRDYDAVTAYFNKTFSDLWLAQLSYTWSRAFGNYPGLFRAETGQLHPNINSDFDLISLLKNRTGLLPGDATHSIKAFGAKEFVFAQNFSANLGLSYRGTSGTPISYLVGHPIYGPGEGFLIPRGAGGRTPFVHRIDANLGLNYKLSKDNILTANMDVFNIFNFQTVTAVDENFTFGTLAPIEGGTKAQADALDPATTGKNPNFLKPTQYQSPRSIRFGVKMTF